MKPSDSFGRKKSLRKPLPKSNVTPIKKVVSIVAPKAKSTAKDRFAAYAAWIVLIGFMVIALIVYQTRFAGKIAPESSYVQLKEQIVNDQKIVTRMTVTVQAKAADQDWLLANQKTLNEHFKSETSKLDMNALRTKEGIVEAQAELTRRFNLILNTDKIQSVLITDLLLQDQT